MRKTYSFVWLMLLGIALVLANGSGQATAAPEAAISLSSPYSQDFDTLATSGASNTWTNDSTISGWYSTRTTYSAGDGSVNTGALYSFGTGVTAERALGSVASGGTGTIYYGVRLVNDTGSPISGLTVSYIGEQWRNGGNTTAHTLQFTYQVGASMTSLTTGVWTDVNTLDFTGPIATATAGALNGNSGANQVSLTDTFAISVPAGQEVMFRWEDINDAGNDHGLGIDTFSVSTTVSDTAPSVSSTTPADSATNVALNSDLSLTFSEDVTVDAGWYDISCGSSGNHTATVSGGPLTWTINPDSDFVVSETCTVTLNKDLVHDSDSDDPPDTMAADYVWSFTTISSAFGSCGDNSETLISAIQGSGATSPEVGNVKVIEGVVVGDFQTTVTELSGFYLQEEDSDADGSITTSEGIFVFDNGFGTAVANGDVVRVMGTVVEFTPGGYTQSLTELSTIIAVTVCSSGSSVTPSVITLPAASPTELEQYEGMSVILPQELTVTETFTLGRYGEVLLAANGRVFQYTHFNLPSIAGNSAYQAAVALQTIVLDDANTQQNRDPILEPAPGGLSALNTLRSGYTITGLSGVLDQRFDLYRIQRNTAVTFTSTTNPRTVAPTLTGSVRVASFNVLNYFNGDGLGGGFPTSRGATSLVEFNRQRSKTIAAIVGLDADIVGLLEIENDATPNSAIEDLVSGLNTATSPGTYAFINTGVLGSDEIRVALIYKPGRVTPFGSYMTDLAAIFDRPPLAQTFQVNLTDEIFTVVINHFKSKNCIGATGLDLDQLDGQGCYNDRREQQANQLLSFINSTVVPTSGDSDVLIIGDLNSYAMEDPITALTGGGYVNLVNLFLGTTDYSYVFGGQWGNLDHALASNVFTAEAVAVTPWHINADEPIALDYNLEFKSVGQQSSLYNADPYRSSDHDPIVIGLFDYDFGDLPTSYGTPWHTGGGYLRLGNNWTSDLNPGLNNDDGSDDGVVRSSFPWQAGNLASIDVTASEASYLSCWFDWNNDGVFDLSEQAVSQLVNAGLQSVSFTVGSAFNPAGNPTLYVRCRLYPFTLAPQGGAIPIGGTVGGEVEDYAWSFSPTAISLQSISINHLQTNLIVMVIGLVALLTLVWYRRPGQQ